MSNFDEVVKIIINQSALLFRHVPIEQRLRAITDRIEQVRGMVELARRFDYPNLAQRLEQHIAVLQQSLNQH